MASKYGAAALASVLAIAGTLPLSAQDATIQAGEDASLPEPEVKPLAIDFSNDPVLGLADATAEPDTFRTIVVAGIDKIALDTSAFDIAEGVLDASVFVQGSDAQDWDDRIIYDQTTGELWYDADGIGGIQKKLIAVLDNNFALQAWHIEGFAPAVNAAPVKPPLDDLAMADQVMV